MTSQDFQVQRDLPTPIHHQIKRWIRDQIASGTWPGHYKLKAETDLAEELGVSRGTVRQAVSDLIKDGMLVRIHGRGTFVSTSYREQPLAERMISISEDLISKGIPFETRVLAQSVIRPSPVVASLLSISPASQVFYLKRLRIVRQIPVVLIENSIVLHKCPGIEHTDFTSQRLLYTLENMFGLQLDWARRTFEARKADDQVAISLEILPGDPVMYLEQILYLRDGSAIETSKVWLRGDGYRLTAIVGRDKHIPDDSSILSF